MLPPPVSLSTDQLQKRPLTQDVIPFLQNIMFQHTNPLSFETEPHNLHTIPLVLEESYLYYFQYKTLEPLHSQNPFNLLLTQLKV